MTDGWAVLVTMRVLNGGESKQVYYAAISDRFAAEEAVKKAVSATSDVRVEAQKAISAAVFREKNYRDGQIGQWI